MENLSFDSDILLKVKHLSKCIKKDYDDRLAEYGLTGQQGRILFFVAKKNKEDIEVHQNDIEERFLLSKSSISEIITRMIKTDYLKKEKKNKFCIIKPTEKGEEIVEKILEHRQCIIEKLFTGFTKEDVIKISKSIDSMITNMGKENENVAKN